MRTVLGFSDREKGYRFGHELVTMVQEDSPDLVSRVAQWLVAFLPRAANATTEEIQATAWVLTKLTKGWLTVSEDDVLLFMQLAVRLAQMGDMTGHHEPQ